jgi:hypothetical protein
MEFHRLLRTIILCVFAVFANLLFVLLVSLLRMPLFMDTLFTLAVTFLAGPLWGFVTAALTQIVLAIYQRTLSDMLYLFCSSSAVFLVWSFHSRYHLLEEGGGYGVFNLVSLLLILSLYMCILISISGGLIAWLIPILWKQTPNYGTPESYFKMGMLLNRYPILLAEILSRFPVNIPDRFLSVYGAYGFALLLQKSRLYPGSRTKA